MSREGYWRAGVLLRPHSKRRARLWVGRATAALSRWPARKIVIGLLLAMLLLYESRTSGIQARLLSLLAARSFYEVGLGPSPAVVFPTTGPLNETRGYSLLPSFQLHLADSGFRIVEQARQSQGFRRLLSLDITPPYDEPATAGLIIRGEKGSVLYDAAADERARSFQSYDEIPEIVLKTLLFIENRELEEPGIPTRNPVVDWGRLVKAGFLYAGHEVGLSSPVEGASTLATQLEKFRYADKGRTSSPDDKLRQMIAASLRAYRSGPDTTSERRRIVLDYLNSMPLSGTPGYGEVQGFGNGLYAWFGIDLRTALSTVTGAGFSPERDRVLKHMLALICAARAPSYYLRTDRQALDERVDYYLRQLQAAAVISESVRKRIDSVPLQFLRRAPSTGSASFLQRKAVNAVRAHVGRMLGVTNPYALNRLSVDAGSTLNSTLQDEVISVLQELKDPAFVRTEGLAQPHLLLQGDPTGVTYSFTLFERTPIGNVLRVHADTLDKPFDLNEGMKLELGSTAKLRTLAHYLELVASLYRQYEHLDQSQLVKQQLLAQDPITKWATGVMISTPGISLSDVLKAALERRYSGSPAEVFFTGGGAHVFSNFDRSEDGMSFTLRDGLKHSVNLVYVRLMRDLVRFHEARLPYSREAVLNDPLDPMRIALLKEIAEQESQTQLRQSYEQYRHLSADEVVDRLLGGRRRSDRLLAMIFLAWNPEAHADDLGRWLDTQGISSSKDAVERLFRAYDPARLNISDYGYLLDRHPLEVWSAGQLLRDPNVSWESLLESSADARKTSSQWLFRTKNRRAQDLRLRVRIEQEAFERMTDYWRKLGFPFDHLVPSFATAIGSSADRPVALAELMGIILNDGVRMPLLRINRLRVAAETPYETVFEAQHDAGEKLMEPEVAEALRDTLAGVVQGGTAVRLSGAFAGPDGKAIVAGGKTGSGDNRFKTYSRGGHLISSRPVSRTATFVFYIGDRYFGVLTAYVGGKQAGTYSFTSALPVATLKILAPTLVSSLGAETTNQ
jgi:membrane peptidoglycan carboxypeptidase